MVKNLPVNAGDSGDACSIPGWGRSPGGGNGTPLRYSYQEILMERDAWQGLGLQSVGCARSDRTCSRFILDVTYFI